MRVAPARTTLTGLASTYPPAALASVSASTDAGRQAVASAQQARTGGDPLAALASLHDAEARLDATLAPFREHAEQGAGAQAQATDLLGRVTSQVRGVSDYVETRRGAVGPEARTGLSEAARLAQQAQVMLPTDPTAALAQVQQAGSLAEQARQLAQADVQQKKGSAPTVWAAAWDRRRAIVQRAPRQLSGPVGRIDA